MTDSDDSSRDHGFDECPICGRFDDLLDICGHYYFVCYEHGTTWYAGFTPSSSGRADVVAFGRFLSKLIGAKS
jgi:hypothetical protein